MSVFKCKMCGGALEINGNETVAVCEYCGTKQTLPHLNDDKKANLYDRANHFRRNNDFDKAMAIYEQILNEDNTDAEAYWSLVLCRYGIEYVEDPSSHKHIPTVNRAQFTSVFDDDNYKSALRYADAAQREVYEEEAKAINEIQKGILAISQKEEPFDVFICYKETDSNGRRTQDSVLANDLYHQLKQEGFKVFFSRITLEDKLGSAYEPYIFAALNSAKVMVVLGTKPEYLNAVWVKNEWSRYLALVKQSNGKKILIPAYRDMDPYDLPEEFSHLQAQDMSKLGFMQDLIRGIKKIISVGSPKTAVKETVVINGGNSNTAPLLKRAFMFLEDGNWEEADEYCEKVLDQDPENAQAYLGKLMAELRVRKQEQLAECEETFENNGNYQKALRFGSKEFRATLEKYVALNVYNDAITEMEKADTEYLYKAVAEKFKAIGGFKDADELAQQCLDKAEICRKDSIYESAVARKNANIIKSLEEAIVFFKSIPDWKDSEEQIYDCQRKIEEIRLQEETERLELKRKAELERTKKERNAKRNKKIAIITTPIICACLIFAIVLSTIIIPNLKYNKALELYDLGKYNEAITAFDELNGYKDSEGQIEKCNIGKYGEETWEKIKSIEVGDIYTFGSYEQDNDSSNGKENIEWQVLAKEDSKILVISDKALERQDFDASYTGDVTWETCTLRKWLNDDFLSVAFNSEEKEKIQITNVMADNNPFYDTDPGNSTQDKVFLLSSTEAYKYFSSDSTRECRETAYSDGERERGCKWWLRSPGQYQQEFACVDADGSIDNGGEWTHAVLIAVRPALWIDLA